MKSINCLPGEVNFVEPVQSLINIKSNLIINDCTMREGEQASTIKFSLKQKVELAEKLAELGVPQIQVGFAKSEEARNAIKEIKKQGLPLKLEAIVQTYKYQEGWYETFLKAVDCGADIISMIYPGSEVRYKYVEKVTHEEVIDYCKQAYYKIADQGVAVRMSFSDATRGNVDFLKRITSEMAGTGIDRIAISDTTGAIMPTAMKHLVSEVVKVAGDVAIQVHCHNDFGLAVANSLAAVEAGASIVDVTINGLGERAGNTPMDELVMSLLILYNHDLGIKTKLLYELSQLVSNQLKTPIPPRKPFVGVEAFAHKNSAHVKLTEDYSFAFETISPDLVGNTRKIG